MAEDYSGYVGMRVSCALSMLPIGGGERYVMHVSHDPGLHRALDRRRRVALMPGVLRMKGYLFKEKKEGGHPSGWKYCVYRTGARRKQMCIFRFTYRGFARSASANCAIHAGAPHRGSASALVLVCRKQFVGRFASCRFGCRLLLDDRAGTCHRCLEGGMGGG